MITLFHGSYLPVTSPFVKLGRKKVDFGQGFYLTKLREQAQSRTQTISERKGRRLNAVISMYSLDVDALTYIIHRVP